MPKRSPVESSKCDDARALLARQKRELRRVKRELHEETRERLRVEQMLQECNQEYQTGFELAATGQVHTDVRTMKFIRVNRRLCEMTGYSRDELLSMRADSLSHPEERAHAVTLLRQLLSGEINQYHFEGRCVCKDGHIMWVTITSALIRNPDRQPSHTIAVIQDVTARKMAVEKLRHDAHHDSLTGLANRPQLMNRLEVSFAKYQQDSRQIFAVLYMDLDRFKAVNDSLGHLVGDALLVAVADRLREVVRGGDVIARASSTGEIVRLGGDEFVLLLESAGGLELAVCVAERIQQRLCDPYEIQGLRILTRASVGIASPRPEHQSADEVLRDADNALYRAKQRRGSLVVFDPLAFQRSDADAA